MLFPGLEPKPALLPITAAGGEGASPAVAAAAQIKAEEDKADQKIKAIRYLSTLGCVKCYAGIEDGLLAALGDCTEAVRYEAVKALRKNADDDCQVCKAGSCCTPKLVKKLEELAHKSDDQGCFVEPSARVRRLARLTLSSCGGGVPVTEEPTPAEGPSGDTAQEPAPEAEAASQPKSDTAPVTTEGKVNSEIGPTSKPDQKLEPAVSLTPGSGPTVKTNVEPEVRGLDEPTSKSSTVNDEFEKQPALERLPSAATKSSSRRRTLLSQRPRVSLLPFQDTEAAQ
jgi:hypothetical protein